MTDPFSPAGRFEERRRDAEQQRAQERMNRRPTTTKTEEMDRVRHKKRGTEYTVLGVGRAQGALQDEDPVVLYRGDDGRLWARHQAEFCDGRFERIDCRPTVPEGLVDCWPGHVLSAEDGHSWKVRCSCGAVCSGPNPKVAQMAWRDHLAALRSTPAPDALADARIDSAYYEGARQALRMAEQSMDAARKWVSDGCGGRAGVYAAALRTEGKPS